MKNNGDWKMENGKFINEQLDEALLAKNAF